VPRRPRRTRDNLPDLVDRFDDAVDAAWGRAFRGHPLADRVFYLASELGDFSVLWLIIAAAQGLRSDEDADTSLRFAALLLGESLLVNQGIKRLVKRPRPEVVEERPLHVRRPMTSSFPSGHASSAMAAAHLLGRRTPRLRPLYYGLAAIVATSRVHVQVHHASDVVAGAAIGTGYARLADRWVPTRRR
jgi:membrane-associated phospholipid phosphatase